MIASFKTKVFLSLYILALLLFAIADLLWVIIISAPFYQSQIGHLLGEVSEIGVLLFYVVFILGLTFFAIYPAYTKGTLLSAALLGLLFGFFTYGTYGLLNAATLHNWSLAVVLVSIMWGTVLCAFVSVVALFMYKRSL